MEFWLYDAGKTPLVKHLHGVWVPEKSKSHRVERLDVLLVPLLAFDSNLFRLGFGSGYYDLTIAHLRQK
jgi:5-formyltetrahydrofolate cyclo-ligase